MLQNAYGGIPENKKTTDRRWRENKYRRPFPPTSPTPPPPRLRSMTVNKGKQGESRIKSQWSEYSRILLARYLKSGK